MNRFSLILLSLAALSAAAGQLLFKIGARGREQWIDFLNIPIMTGLLFYGLSTVMWIYALSFEKLVNVYAFTALTFVLVYLGGVFIINEQITGVALVGIILVLAGLYLIVSYNV